MRQIRWRIFLFFLGGGIAFLLVIFSMQVTSTPTFCGSCHVMRPYYDSWETSSHNRVVCVECHIPPGLGSEFRKKYEALSMAVRYITGTYGTNPWTEVDDAACLRCHDKRLIQGRELFGKVIFNHTPHLLQLRRGKRLRCTSCHSQIVQGKHISATVTTCYLCHFKDEVSGKGTARCNICHITPDRIVESQGVRFDHGDVERFGMECNWCHSKSVQGNGEVPKERCLICHNQPDRLRKYGAGEFLHKVHVTEHKVECLDCHLEIQHGAISLEAAATSCDQCHISGHNTVRDLYAGIGGKGVHPEPSKMFLTGITCEGCHFLPDTLKGGIKKANEVSCMACHGPRYRYIYWSWKETIEKAIKGLKTVLVGIPYQFKKSDVYQDIVKNLDLVEEGNGIHNPDYSLSLIRWSYEQLREKIGTETLPSWGEIPYTTPCVSCHKGITLREEKFRGYSFSHGIHITKQAIQCENCHRSHKERRNSEVLKPGVDCASCHHKKDIQRNCNQCHRAGPQQITLSDNRVFPHSLHTGEDIGLDCGECHTKNLKVSFETCEECHG